MRMDAGLDTGPIVAQRRVALSGNETAPVLEDRLSLDAAGLLAGSVGPWVRGDLEALPQPDEGATLTRPLKREDGRLVADNTAAVLERQVRAYQPWPGSFIDTPNGRLIVLRAKVAPGPAESPGRLVAGEDLRLSTADGWLVLEEVQPAGQATDERRQLLRVGARNFAERNLDLRRDSSSNSRHRSADRDS